MHERRLDSGEWLSPTFSKHYDPDPVEIQSLEAQAQHSLYRNFYDQLHELIRLKFRNNRRIISRFSRTVAQHDPSKSNLPDDFIFQAHRWYRDHDSPDAHSEQFKIPYASMDSILTYVINNMRDRITRVQNNDVPLPDSHSDLLDSFVALQRTVSSYDPAVSLTTARLGVPETGRRSKYVIRFSDKDPVHFYTGGNDTGVCDSTAGLQRATLKDTTRNPAMQFPEIFRVDARGREKRIGQIRMYLGETKEGPRFSPALLVNSIDLEAEERDNLLLYRRAVDFTKQFATRMGVNNVRLGRHGDMHLMVFEKSGIFPDLTPVQEPVRLAHFFNPHTVRPFSDFFRGVSLEVGKYSDVHGTANLYHVALPSVV